MTIKFIWDLISNIQTANSIKEWLSWKPFRDALKNRFIDKIGLRFDFEGFLGSKKEEDKFPIIACIQAPVQNLSKKFVKLEDAYILSNITGKKIKIRISVKNNYEEIKDLDSGIPPTKQWYQTQALFYEPNNSVQEGLGYEKFLKEFGNFSYIVVKDGKKVIIKTITPKNIKTLLTKQHNLN